MSKPTTVPAVNAPAKLDPNAFAGIGDVKLKKGGIYTAPGNYELEVIACTQGTSRKYNCPYFVVDFKVISSDNPDRPAGSTMTWMVTCRFDILEVSLKNIAEFLSKALDLKASVQPSDVARATAADQPLAGKRFRAAFVEKDKRSATADERAQGKGKYTAAQWIAVLN